MNNPPSQPKHTIDKLAFALFIAGLLLLAYIGGAASLYYKGPGSEMIQEGFQGGETWISEYRQHHVGTAQPQVASKKMDSIIEGGLKDAKVTWDKSKAFDGYTSISLRFSTKVYLVDMNGHIVHEWNMPFAKAWPHPEHIHKNIRARIMIETAQVFPNGDLIAQYSGVGDTPYGYGFVKMDKNSKVIWTYDENTHHDVYVAENGDIYGLAQSIIKTPLKDLEKLSYPLLTDYVVHLTPDGKEIERVLIADALVHSPYASLLQYRSKLDSVWDHFHSNSVMKLEPSIADKFPMLKAGQVLVSVRNLNAVVVVDMNTKKVVWAATGDWRRQHAAHFLPNGHIVLFDNLGLTHKGEHHSRVAEIDPKTSKIVWEFSGDAANPFFSEIHGRTQHLPNGNMLTAESKDLRVLEITPKKEVAWDYKIDEIKRDHVVMTDIMSAMRYGKDSLTFLKE